jgi:DNA-binding beta-propeller fold protein YncE
VDAYAGIGVQGSAGDDGPALAAQVDRPHGLLISAADGALLIADTDNHKIRRIDPVTRIITTLSAAFDGPAGLCHGPNGETYVTDRGRIDTPLSCAVDANGKLYVVEAGGSGTIRVVDTAGKISTLSRPRA